MYQKRKKPHKNLRWKTAKPLQKKIDAYFENCQREVGSGKSKRKVYIEHPTITGLAVWLDTDRITLLRYENENKTCKEAVRNTIKAAKVRIEKYMEQLLLDKNVCAGVIFNLKNNFGWRDEKQLEVKGDLQIEATVAGIKVEIEEDGA